MQPAVPAAARGRAQQPLVPRAAPPPPGSPGISFSTRAPSSQAHFRGRPSYSLTANRAAAASQVRQPGRAGASRRPEDLRPLLGKRKGKQGTQGLNQSGVPRQRPHVSEPEATKRARLRCCPAEPTLCWLEPQREIQYIMSDI